ncbi:MAG: hypothetical protein MZU79_05985, partial [Anaerotruncus sp.]|nr:hypothetical protein [Anaerotruncus sp.]
MPMFLSKTGYFEFLMGKFAEDPRLGVAGTPFVEDSGYSSSRDSHEGERHVAGGCQLFRRRCFNDIGSFIANRRRHRLDRGDNGPDERLDNPFFRRKVVPPSPQLYKEPGEQLLVGLFQLRKKVLVIPFVVVCLTLAIRG